MAGRHWLRRTIDPRFRSRFALDDDQTQHAAPDMVGHPTERELERLSPRWNALFEFIYLTPAVGLVGAAVKLRLLTDRAIGLAAGFDEEIEGVALRDVRRIVERELLLTAAFERAAERLRADGHEDPWPDDLWARDARLGLWAE